MEFKGKVAVVTGAASGIGRSIALALAGLGTDIVVADIDDIPLEEVRQEIEGMGCHALAVHCDVSKDADVESLAAQTLSTLPSVDILVNNAGRVVQGLVEKLSMADWEWILGINILGIIRGVRAFLPHMLERGSGYIVNIASITGLMTTYGPPYVFLKNIAYSTSKFAVVGFSEGLYTYLRPKGIMVSVLCPGGVATNIRFHARYVGDDPKEINDLKSEGEELFKQPDMIEPDDVAQILVRAMKEKRFLILTHPEVQASLMNQGRDIQKYEKYLQNTF